MNIEFYRKNNNYYILLDNKEYEFSDFNKNNNLADTVRKALTDYFREQSGFKNIVLYDALEAFKDNNDIPDIKLRAKINNNGDIYFIPIDYDNDEFNSNFALLLLKGKYKSNNAQN